MFLIVVGDFCGGVDEAKNLKFYFGYINLEFSVGLQVGNETSLCTAQTGATVMKVGAASAGTDLTPWGDAATRHGGRPERAVRGRPGPQHPAMQRWQQEPGWHEEQQANDRRKGSQLGRAEHRWCGGWFRACRAFFSKPAEKSGLDFDPKRYCPCLERSLTLPMRPAPDLFGCS